MSASMRVTAAIVIAATSLSAAHAVAATEPGASAVGGMPGYLWIAISIALGIALFVLARRFRLLLGANAELSAALAGREDRDDRYRLIVDTANEGYWLIGEGGKTIEVNDALCRMLGYARDEMLGKTPFDFVDEENRKVFEYQIGRRSETDRRAYEITLTAKDGSDVYTRFSASTLQTLPDSQAVSFAFVTDITESKRQAQELKRQKTLFEAVFRDVPDAMVLTDVDRHIVMCNPAFTRIFGYEPDEVIGRETRFLHADSETYEEQGRLRFNLDASERLEPYEISYRRKNGQVFPSETVGTAVKDQNGDILGFIGVMRDISGRRIALDELAKRTAELSNEVEERRKAQHAMQESTALVGLLHSIAEAANKADSVEEVIRVCLDNVCTYKDWPVGHAYLKDPDHEDRLFPTGIWFLKDNERYSTFQELTRDTLFESGVGLPGRVMANAEPAWIVDLQEDSNFPRAQSAGEIGLKSGFALPILIGSDVAGVLEFFSDQTEEADQSLFYVLVQIGSQIGRVIERAEAGRALRENEERKSSILASALDGIITIDAEGKVIEFNPSAREMFGYTDEEVQGKSVADLIIPPEFRDAHSKGMKRYLETGKSDILSRRIELTALRKNGEVFPVELTVAPIEQGDHKIFTAFLRDLTERKAAEESLRKLSAAVEQSPVSVVITDTEGTIEYVNSTFTEVTGFQPEEAIGQTPGILKSGNTPEAVYDELWSTIKAGLQWQGELNNKKKNGELFWEYVIISPIKNVDGDITHFLAVKEDVSLRKEYEERLLHQANYDDLTDLPNRLLAMDRLAQAATAAARDGESVALLCVNLDNLKKVNDVLSHAAGDQVLQETAKRITRNVQSGHTVARLGADEFLVILPGIKAGVFAEVVAQRILNACAEPYMAEGNEFRLSARIGVTISPNDGTDPNVLLRNAHAAMVRAKEKGGNTYRFFTSAMDQESLDRLHMENLLRRALDNEELFVHYQPLVKVGTGEVIGAEALVRWENPELGFVPPDKFIPLAEATGLIVPLGAWVLETACQDAKAWQPEDGSVFRIAVNFSALQFQESGILDVVGAALEKAGLAPECLEVEVTERLVMDEEAQSTAVLHGLSTLGAGLSIDDFGTGYSALGYLKRYPFDTLKIDRSFVQEVNSNPEDAALANAIIAMAHGLGLKVIAEGVETQDQLSYLRFQGCDFAQGYLFSKPLSREAFSDYLNGTLGKERSTG